MNIKSCATATELLLDVKANDFRTVGICGIGGIVKTTIAKAVYKKIAKHFDRSCFLENVRENSRTSDSIIQLQKKLLFTISRDKHLNVESVTHGTNMIREWLQRKTVLLILDDVDEPNQIVNLIGSCDWFVSRSRVLITTKDKNVQATLGKVCTTHKVKELDKCFALELSNSQDYFEVANPVIQHARGLSLAIKIVDSDMCGRTKSEWEGVIRGKL